MSEEKQYYKRALGLAVVLHVLGAAVIGGCVYLPSKVKDSRIIEVALAGAPKKNVAKVNKSKSKPNSKTVVKTRPDDIVDKVIKEPTSKLEDVAAEKKNSADESSDSIDNGNDATESSSGESGVEGAVGTGSGTTNVESIPVQLPYVTYKEDPAYPGEARKQGVQGTVYLRVLIETNGRAIEASVVGSSGSVALDQSALNAVYKWRFSPAKDAKGQKVRCYVNIPVKFKLR